MTSGAWRCVPFAQVGLQVLYEMIPRPMLVAWPQLCHTSLKAVTLPSEQARIKDFGWTTVRLKQSARPAVLGPELADEGLDDEPQAAIGRVTAISIAADA